MLSTILLAAFVATQTNRLLKIKACAIHSLHQTETPTFLEVLDQLLAVFKGVEVTHTISNPVCQRQLLKSGFSNKRLRSPCLDL